MGYGPHSLKDCLFPLMLVLQLDSEGNVNFLLALSRTNLPLSLIIPAEKSVRYVEYITWTSRASMSYNDYNIRNQVYKKSSGPGRYIILAMASALKQNAD